MPQTDIVTRLWWDGRRGVAQHDGLTLELHHAPAIGVPHLAEVDYAPALRVSQVREHSNRWRDMTPAERQAAQGLLQRAAAAAHAAATAQQTNERIV